MNQNTGGTAPYRTIAGSRAQDDPSIWAVPLIALAIIGIMYIYDRAFAQEAPPRPPTEISCHPPPAVVTDAETFKPRS